MNKNNRYIKINQYFDKKTLKTLKAELKNINQDDDGAMEIIAKYLCEIITLVRCEQDGELYIYNLNNYYEKAEDWMLKSLFKLLLNELGFIWTTKFEREGLGALKRDSITVINEFNSSNTLNFKNGLFSFDDGELHPHNPNNTLCTYILDYEYDKNANCLFFLKFIEETTCGDKQLQAVLQEVIGYSLSNETKAEKAIMFFGTGCNGKSVLASIMTKLVAEEQTCAISLDALNEKFSMAGFIGKRLNIAAENEKFPNSEKLKTLVSCDKVNVCIKYQSDWVGRLQTKHIFLMNELPVTPDVTYGFFRKIMIVPFNNIVKVEDIDRDLVQKLSLELSGIFNWAYEGYLRLVSNDFNFSKCDVIEQIMLEYKNRENPTGEFFHAMYEKYCGSKIIKSSIYDKYVDWSANNGLMPMSRNKFFKALQLKASETNSNINLDFRKINGYMYLVEYRERRPEMQDDDPVDYDYDLTCID